MDTYEEDKWGMVPNLVPRYCVLSICWGGGMCPMLKKGESFQKGWLLLWEGDLV